MELQNHMNLLVTKTMITDDEKELFIKSVGRVRTLEYRHSRVEPSKKRLQKTDNANHELDLLWEGGVHADQSTKAMPVPELDRDHGFRGMIADLPLRTFKDLQHGHVAWQKRLDLHGTTREQAYDLLSRCMEQAVACSFRCLLVITGKGNSSPAGVSVLRQLLPQWLTEQPLGAQVLAFCLATIKDGGEGAFYVLLRKSKNNPKSSAK